MDLVIILVIIALVVILRRDLKSFIYSLGALEIFFRVIHFIGDHLGIIKLNEFINNYIPDSIKTVLEQYSDGLLESILVWIFVIFMGILAFDDSVYSGTSV